MSVRGRFKNDHGPIGAIPKAMRGLNRDTFAYYTVAVNLPDIGRRVLAENDLSKAAVYKMEVLLDEIPEGGICPLKDVLASRAKDWAAYVAPYLGQNWLEVPWFFAEIYFYRRILEATGYFRAGTGKGMDPFGYQKRAGLERSRDAIGFFCGQMERWLFESPGQGVDKGEALRGLIKMSLWGNQADLSIWPADREASPEYKDVQERGAHLAVDETEAVIRYLASLENKGVRIEVLVDNAGMELVSDLGLIDYLLSSQIIEQARLHLKTDPVFVSDAMVKDVDYTLAFLASHAERAVRRLAERLGDHRATGRLQLQEEAFWVSPLSGWEMPSRLRAGLAKAELLISKGDIHYRRLLGDRHWPFTKPLSEVVGYLPTPLAALRVLKGDIVAGLPVGRAEALKAVDPEWMVNGKWGLVQFVEGRINDKNQVAG